MYDNYNYCYMRSILTDIDNRTRGFCLIFCDNKFKQIGVLNTDVEGLKKIATNTELIKDFSIEDNYLKCDNVSRMPITSEDLKTFGNLIDCSSYEKTFLDFLEFGNDNNFFIVDKSITELQDYTGVSFTSFRNIEFSQSTMTIYCKLISNDTIHNQMLVALNGQNLEITQFYFAVPISVKLPDWLETFCVKELHECTLNNMEFVLYEMQGMPIYISNMLKSSALINKAATLKVKYRNIIEVIKGFKSVLHTMLGYQGQESKLEWTGGSNSYKSAYGVYLKSSWPFFNKASVSKCVDWYVELLERYASEPDKVVQIIETDSVNEMTKLALLTVHRLMLSDLDLTQVLLNCENTINDLQQMRLSCDIYLYKMRVFAYFKGTRLAPAANSILQGSDENAYTIVEHKLSYGME